MKYEFKIESPFIEADLETYEIHKFLKENNIEYSRSTTCLATRVKTNETVTIDKVNRIDYCEDFIKKATGSEVVKLREANNVATIELDDINNIFDNEKLKSIYDELKNAQYDKILLNIDFSNDDGDLVLDSELSVGKDYLLLRKRLPFGINISQTDKVLKENDYAFISNVQTNESIGYIKLIVDNKESKIFRGGVISIEGNKSKKDAVNSLVKVLPLIRRTVDE